MRRTRIDMSRLSNTVGRAGVALATDDVSGDVSHVSHVGDRGLWLAEACPACGTAPGAHCRLAHGTSRQPILHIARGWQRRRCPVCRAGPDEACVTPSGRMTPGPHAARRAPSRGELALAAEVWRALEGISARVARVRFSGGGGRRGHVEVVAVSAGGGELARWQAGESELGDALAVPVWARYGVFRGQPLIIGTLVWSVAERSITLADRRGSERFVETVAGAVAGPRARDASRDTSRMAGPAIESRACERCGEAIASSARVEARYCSKRCRQAASRARLRALWGPPARAALERCVWCEGPMPVGLRVEACFCSKRCRQAASRARLADAGGRARDSRPGAGTTPSGAVGDRSRDASLLARDHGSSRARGRAR